MVKTIVIAMSLAVATGAAQGVSPGAVTLQDLTVPAERLPPACSLAVAPSKRVAPNRVVTGLWAGLPMTTNPWTGTDPYVMATIRSRMAPSPPPGVPDGPPLHRRAAARYFLRLAEGMEEAYAAVYATDERDLIAVYAFRVAAARKSGDRPSTRRVFKHAVTTRVEIGSIVAMVSSNGGECFDAIEAYVRSLAAR